MRRLIALLLGVLAVTGCGVRPSGVIPGEYAPAGQSANPVVFFLADNQLAPVTRQVKSVNQALARLATGPTTQERDGGMSTELPVGITLRASSETPSLTVEVSVDLQTLTPLAVDQIVCTAATAAREPMPGGITLTGGGTTLPNQYCGR